MRTSETGLALIKKCEGFRAYPYLDPAGIPTIGYGHRITLGEAYPNGIGEPYAAMLLARDVATAEHAVMRLVKVQLTQAQFDALVDFVYNLGAGRLAESTLLRLLNAGDYAVAAEQLLAWDHAGGKEQPGLKARRESERAMFLSEVTHDEA